MDDTVIIHFFNGGNIIILTGGAVYDFHSDAFVASIW